MTYSKTSHARSGLFGIMSLAGIFMIGLTASGCTTFAKADTAIDTVSQSKQFRTLCSIEPSLYAGFTAIANAPQLHVSDKLKANANTAHLVIRNTCANPPSDVATALLTAYNAYMTILDAQSDAVAEVK